jgi:hypothetical protein
VLESLGRKALAAGDNKLAAKAFEEALVQYPESTHARAGLKAAAGQGTKATAAGL